MIRPNSLIWDLTWVDVVKKLSLFLILFYELKKKNLN